MVTVVAWSKGRGILILCDWELFGFSYDVFHGGFIRDFKPGLRTVYQDLTSCSFLFIVLIHRVMQVTQFC